MKTKININTNRIMKDNKRIAEFMEVDGYLSLSQMQYHNSWDWLMPVIDKCYQEHMSKHIADAVMTCDIDKVYKVVAEFINQLNK